jgi:hypothetical protein
MVVVIPADPQVMVAAVAAELGPLEQLDLLQLAVLAV